MITVTALSVCPVKGTRLQRTDEVTLGPAGAVGDREFFVADARGRMVNGKVIGELQQVVARREESTLSLQLPDGRTVRDEVRLGETIQSAFFSRQRAVRPVLGPFSEALSALAGRPLTLVRPETSAVDRGTDGAITLISRASLQRLAAEAGQGAVDARRFRMLIEVDGVEAHAEDAWVGREATVGGARVRFQGHVGRCLVTSRDPDSGQIDLPTLDILRGYRDDVRETEPLPFGVYGAVLAGGPVRLGDAMDVLR